MSQLPERAIKIHYDFEEVFYENAANNAYSKAYEMAEQEHERYYGRRRYASYDSFRLRKRRK